MSINLWQKKFTAERLQKTPKDIIKEQCDNLYNATNRIIIGRISEYEGSIHDELKINIKPVRQSKLGVLADSDMFVYEFYITSIKTPKYKYRAFFIQHDISLYPVTFLLDADIAKQINTANEFSAENEDEFIRRLSEIFNSTKIEKIITSLLNFNIKDS